MSTETYCDKCQEIDDKSSGSFFKYTPERLSPYMLAGDSEPLPFDVCPTCYAELLGWLKDE